VDEPQLNLAIITVSCDYENDGPIEVDLGDVPVSLAYLWLVQAAESIKYGTLNLKVVSHGETVIGPNQFGGHDE
jgi:hypothetical protein